jgi:hypothetical protein
VTADDIARKFPEAVAFARQLRDVFGPEVRLLYARNQQGEELGRLDPKNRA